MEASQQRHPFPPLYNSESRVLILGSFPSVKSREDAFFYAHPRNRFWPLMAEILNEPPPATREEKAAMLLRHRIALWDVVGRCEIAGSADASIRGVAANDLTPIFRAADIRGVFCNGDTSFSYYNWLCRPVLNTEAVRLPSTSPANARWTLSRLAEVWGSAILPLLDC